MLLAVLAGGAASFDSAARPDFLLLAAFAAFLLATVVGEGALLHPPAPGHYARAWLAFGVAILLAVPLVAARGWLLFWLCAAAALATLAYAAGPRLRETALAGPITIAQLGPLASAGTAVALVGAAGPAATWIGLPLGFLADAERRARAEARTPGDGAPPWLAADVLAALGLVPALIAAHALPPSALAALVAAPLLAWEVVAIRRASDGAPYSWQATAGRLRRLRLVFTAGLVLAVFLTRHLASRAV